MKTLFKAIVKTRKRVDVFDVVLLIAMLIAGSSPLILAR
ncbi:MAG: hypothetical protein QOJ99_4990 [Bryobacterales bacterium]|jgi:hypothetical protein|nr:hypothetical protein [Bryobacterales bacterium]